jgi:ribose/xylose/arabinose/galactoside ABC-type transport system permease subunit
VDKVCAAARKCVVVVVSGCPLILDPAQLTKIDGLVAAWLPGSEGAGVADTLFGAVYGICDRVTIMRDGRTVDDRALADVTRLELVALMLGKDLAEVRRSGATGFADTTHHAEQRLLEARGLRGAGRTLRHADVRVRAGEIVGLAGLLGSGRTELARAIFGADPVEAGELKVDGRPVRFGSPADATCRPWPRAEPRTASRGAAMARAGDTAAVGHLQRARLWPREVRDLGQAYGAAGALLLLVVYNAVFTDRFLTTDSVYVNLTQVAPIIIVAMGMTLVIATGGIDLSVGSLMAISGALAPLIFLRDIPFGVALAFVVPVLVTGVFGLFNGVLVTRFGFQPIIATLVLFIAGRGIAQVLTNGELQPFRNPTFQYIGLGRVLGVPFQVLLMLAVFAVVAWAVRTTRFGRYVLAIGGNEAAARLAGVPVHGVKLAVYGISGLLAGIAGLIVIAINSSSDANQVGLNLELAAIAAVAVGGTPLAGGRATVVGTLIGALILQLLRFTLLFSYTP